MRGLGSKRVWLGTLCAAALALGAGAGPAQGASSDPLFVFIPVPPLPPAPPIPPPTGKFNGPCGLAVDSAGNFYVSDYYHHTVDVFTPGHSYLGQLVKEDPLDGPCGLAFDSTNDLYVNNYHRNVAKFDPSLSIGAGTVLPLPLEDPSHHLPTGVAVDPTTGNVYVDNRTYISVYDSTGAPVMDGADPLKIGLGSLSDGYGVAFSQFPGTLGRLYVSDAADHTVKVYDPVLDKVNPVATIDGQNILPKPGFVSLRDSAVAVDRVSGKVYVADNLQPAYTEKPQATIQVFSSTGAYLGHLKYNVVDALPPGLAVDNTTGATQGRVYVTSGNTDFAGVYAYPPGAETTLPVLPSAFSLGVSTAGTGAGAVTSDLGGIDCATACEAQIRSGVQVPLTATPDPGSAFAGWSGGGCSGSGACTVTMSEETSVSAEFEALPTSSAPDEAPSAAAAAPAAAARPRHPAHRRHRTHHHRIGHRGSKRRNQ